MLEDKEISEKISYPERLREVIAKKFSLSAGDKSLEMALIAIDTAFMKKAEDTVIIKLQDITVLTDFFIIMTGLSRTQNKAIASAIEEKLKEKGYKRKSHTEGYEDASWILMDYIDFIIHIFLPEKRSFYDLEGLWGDAPLVEIKDI